MRPSKIKAKLKRDEPVLLTTLHFTDPSVWEMTSLQGFDGIWLDLEHHGTSVETAMTLLRAARVGTSDVMVRPAKGEFMRLGRLLEAGAQGIMYPRCADVAEAREVVLWSKFAPLGRRGYDSANPDVPYCAMPMTEYLQAANEQTFIVIQVEDRGAVAEAHMIAELEGVDVLFFGPADFSVLSGIPGQSDHPLVWEAVEGIADAAPRRQALGHANLVAGTLPRRLLDMGARFLCHSADILLVKQGQEEIQRRFGPLGFTFERRLG